MNGSPYEPNTARSRAEDRLGILARVLSLPARAAWGSALLAPVALIGGWTLAASRQPPGYSATRDTISALAAQDATDRWLMTTGFVVLGACHIVTALGFREAAPAGRGLLALGGLLAIGVAIFAEPAATHVPVATASFVALAAWAALAGVPSRRAGLVAAGVLAALLIAFAFTLDSRWTGLTERIVAGGEVLWPLTALALTRLRPSGEASAPRSRPA